MRKMMFQFSKKTIRWHFLWYGIPCFLITKNFLFWVFWRWKIRSSFWPKSWWKYGIYWLLKSSCFELYEDEKYDFFFEPNSWWDYDNYWLLKIFCFELFRDGKHGLFLSQKVHGKMIFTGYWKVFVLNFSMTGNTVFLSEKKFMERCYLIYLLFLSFPWYSRTWKICFFVQCETLAGS